MVSAIFGEKNIKSLNLSEYLLLITAVAQSVDRRLDPKYSVHPLSATLSVGFNESYGLPFRRDDPFSWKPAKVLLCVRHLHLS